MRTYIMTLSIFLLSFLLPAPVFAAEGSKALTPPSLAGEKGIFVLEVGLKGNQLNIGPNSFDLWLRDRGGKEVAGAEITVTPWMPSMGHGVWDKPVVKERGGGHYLVENVVVIMSGRWDLKVNVKSGKSEDRALFSYDVAEKKEQPRKDEGKSGRYQRSTARYSVPNVTLLNQDGKSVNLRSLVESGKPVVINFMFTTCTTICPVMAATFSNLRSELGAGAQRVQLISISIDPENDRPERMKQYLSKFNSGQGWEFLTGSRDDIGRVLKAFDAFVTDKMSHEPLYIFHAPNADEWVRIKGLIRKKDLLKELQLMEGR